MKEETHRAGQCKGISLPASAGVCWLNQSFEAKFPSCGRCSRGRHPIHQRRKGTHIIMT